MILLVNGIFFTDSEFCFGFMMNNQNSKGFTSMVFSERVYNGTCIQVTVQVRVNIADLILTRMVYVKSNK